MHACCLTVGLALLLVLLLLVLLQNNFERGTVDKFMLKTIDVGELTSVVVSGAARG